MTDHKDHPDAESTHDEVRPGGGMKEPTDTDHPTGVEQARANQETESPS